jgi:molybdate transport system ATP-binding protein
VAARRKRFGGLVGQRVVTGPVPPGLSLAGRVERGGFALDVTTTVAPGEVVGLLGPNGAGKSTLLRVVAGLLPLTHGTLRLGDTVLDDAGDGTWVPAERRPVALVFQDYRLFPHLDVRDNVAFAARSGGMGRAASRAQAEPWLRRLDLAGLAARRPSELSGGQAQRVALARALAAEPDVLLLDEPLAALDARTRLDVRTSLREHLGDFPGPCLVVTHDPLDAMVLSDRLLVVEEGRVVQQGPPATVARHPATDYVARLVGLNLYAGRYDPHTHAVALDGGGRLVATPTAGSPLGSGRVLVALSPAAVSLHREPLDGASQRNVWRGRVAGVELLGDRVRVEVHGEPGAIVDVTPAAVAELGLERGREVWLAAKATETLAYPEGARLRS